MLLGTSINGYIDACNLKPKGLNLEKMIKEKMDIEVITRNDGICAGIAEKEYGSLKGYKNGIFMCIGTGVGGACFINGKLVDGIIEIRSYYSRIKWKKVQLWKKRML